VTRAGRLRYAKPQQVEAATRPYKPPTNRTRFKYGAQLTDWLRRPLAEDRAALLALDERVHEALRLIGVPCNHQEGNTNGS
jgi:hypothetical protein